MKTGKNRKHGMVNEQASQILVDIVVGNCSIMARKVSPHTVEIPHNDAEKMLFMELGNGQAMNNRLKNCTYGTLKGRSLKRAERIVDKNGSISTSGEYGSIWINSTDFIGEKALY